MGFPNRKGGGKSSFQRYDLTAQSEPVTAGSTFKKQMSKDQTYNAGFSIDPMSDYPQKLIPVTENPTIQIKYGVDGDGFIEIYEAFVWLGGRQTDLNTKDETIRQWVIKGCEFHQQIQ
jgi:hypothetical protein